jgi:hypothetical protein
VKGNRKRFDDGLGDGDRSRRGARGLIRWPDMKDDDAVRERLVWKDYMLFEDNLSPCGCVVRHGKRWRWWSRDDGGVFHGPASGAPPVGDCATETEAKECCEEAARRFLK